MFAIYKKELRSYFINPIGYVFVGVFLAVAALLCCFTTVRVASYDTSTYFSGLIMTFIILIPLLTMRLFSEERKLKTEQLIMTSPVSITGTVLGKFFAAFTVFLGSLALSCINFIPLFAIAAREQAVLPSGSESHVGPVASEIVGSLIGIILVGAAFIAIGLFISALTEDQLAAAIGTIAVILFMVVMGFVNSMTDAAGNPLISSYAVRFVIDWISVLSRFYNFGYGLFDFAALLYYFSLCAVFVFPTVRVYDSRRWR